MAKPGSKRWMLFAAAAAIAGAVAVAGIGGSQEASEVPSVLREIAKTFPGAVFFKETKERVVALTIDDVPAAHEPGDVSTGLILDAIAAYNARNPEAKVRATFFIISDHLQDGSTIVQRIRDAGHEIGNHGEADDTAATLSAELFERQLIASDKRIREFTDQPIRWYRPGRGLYTPSMEEALGRMKGYQPRFALASMLPVDTFRPTADPRFTAWYVRQHIFPGSILVLHGGSMEMAKHAAEALPAILDDLSRQGYRVVTFSELWDGP
jgi:peptidoglycan/xylan/chitin deacetylase (PgdA/CDA1 family)